MIKRFLNIFLELLFPSKCINCNLRGSILCNTCINNIHLAERPTEESIIALYDYRDQVIKKAIWQLKYYNIPHLGQKLGELLYTELIEEIQLLQTFSQGSPIIVIPVPISKNKKKNRGYNQSEIIARNFRKSSPVKIFDLKTNIIIKKSNTIPQARLTNRNKRLQYIRGSFEIKNIEQIKGKTIIIIDDVTTTGGTMLEIMKVLKKSGAKKVIGFAVAH